MFHVKHRNNRSLNGELGSAMEGRGGVVSAVDLRRQMRELLHGKGLA